MNFRSAAEALCVYLLAPSAILGQSINLTVSNIPALANRITAVVDGTGIADKVWTSQSFAAGTSSFTFLIGVPAGGPYRVRVIAFRSNPAVVTFPAILRSGKSEGNFAAAGAVTNVAVILTDILVSLDASTPATGTAGAITTFKVNITDAGESMAGRTTGRIWYASAPFTQNLMANQTFGPMSQPAPGQRQASVDIHLPSTPGTLYYQFGESAPDFRNPSGQESPFVIGPNVEQGASLWQMAVVVQNSLGLTVANIPAAATKVTAVVDGGGLGSRIIQSATFAAGVTSVTMNIGVPGTGPYRIRAIAYTANSATPAILRSGMIASLTLSGSSGSASVTLSDIFATLDASTPATALGGSVITVKVNITDSGSLLGSTNSMRLWSATSPFVTNFTGAAVAGALASTGTGQWQASIPLTLPGSAGTLYYQVGETPADFRSADGTEFPFLVWPNLQAGASLCQIAVTPGSSLIISVSNLPAAANRAAVVIDGGGLTKKLAATQVFSSGTASVTLNVGVPGGGPYRVRAIAWTSTGSGFPAILRTGKATGVLLAGNSAAVSITLADVAFALDPATPTSANAGSNVTIGVNFTDAGDVLEGAPGARIWYSTAPFTQNVNASQASGYMSTDGNGHYQTTTALTTPGLGQTLYYQFGEAAPDFLQSGETPFLVWPNLSASGELLKIAVAVPAPPVAISTVSLPGGILGAAYQATLGATGGTTPYTWVIIGSLPPGLVLGALTGVISGTPTATGTTSFTVKVTDANAATAAQAITLTIVPATQALQFIPVTPCRIMDTRASGGFAGAFGPPSLAASSWRSVPVPSSSCGIPATAQVYSLNITAIPKGPVLGFLSVWPTGQPQPLVSTLNSWDGKVIANAALVPAGTGGAINVFVSDNADLVIDVNGYFVPPNASSQMFYPLAPCRVLDTRNAVGTFGGPFLSAGVSRSFPLPLSSCGIPASAGSYSLNVTVVPKGTLGYLTAWPTGQPQPLVSTLNSWDGTTLANAAIVPAGTNGSVSFYASNNTDLVVDINGYFAPPNTGGLNFYAATPCRVADTRNAAGSFGGPIMSAGQTRAFPLPQSACALPATAQAYSLNMTVVPPGTLYYLSVWPLGMPQPGVSTLNDYKGLAVANAALVPAGTNGAINAYVPNSSQLLIDVNGYFGP